MSGLSGLEFLQEVRKKHPPSAFVLITAVDDIRVGIQAMKQGAADYLAKPFQLDAVVVSVTQALENKRLQIELEDYRSRLIRDGRATHETTPRRHETH
jgi:FixJ family two-component response regulator